MSPSIEGREKREEVQKFEREKFTHIPQVEAKGELFPRYKFFVESRQIGKFQIWQMLTWRALWKNGRGTRIVSQLATSTSKKKEEEEEEEEEEDAAVDNDNNKNNIVRGKQTHHTQDVYGSHMNCRNKEL